MLESSYSQVPESQLMCLSALELECVNSMFALSLVSTLVTNILLASVQTNDTTCAALLCCAQTAQRTLAYAIFLRLPQARIENMCALRTLLVEDEFQLLMQFAAKHLAIGVNEARAAHLDRQVCSRTATRI
jgi:hypothetical protein